MRSGQMLLVLALGFTAVTASALVAPQAWLMVLGSKYESLSGELVLALVGALLSLIGATLYTMVIATRRTRGQWLQIAIGAGAQAIFVSMFGINNTRDALVLNMIPAAAYAALQMGLLIHILLSWKRDATHH